jgi:hypothetical protein
MPADFLTARIVSVVKNPPLRVSASFRLIIQGNPSDNGQILRSEDAVDGQPLSARHRHSRGGPLSRASALPPDMARR